MASSDNDLIMTGAVTTVVSGPGDVFSLFRHCYSATATAATITATTTTIADAAATTATNTATATTTSAI